MSLWRRAGKADALAVETFLRGREAQAAGLIARLLGESGLRIPSALGPATLWIRTEREGPVEAAALGISGGMWFAQLPRGAGDARGLGSALGPGPRLSSVIGPAASVAAFEEELGADPAHVVDYDLMARGPLASDEGRKARCAISTWRAGSADLAELLPLQEAYEREEVATPLRGFDAESCRAFLARNLAVELIVGARLAPAEPDGDSSAGKAVGKAGTNARAFTLDQIGGVYVVPELRGRGIAAELMTFLLGLTAAEGRGSSLFVKKANAPALALYEGLGYSKLDDFLASYHLAR